MLDLFVYGTLKPGEVNYHICADYVIRARPAIALGQLYSLPLGYPAMTAGNQLIQGVVLSFTDAAILAILDAFEKHDPEKLKRYVPHLPIDTRHTLDYDRRQIKTYDQAHHPIGNAWSYMMQVEHVQLLGGVVVPNGNWSSH